MNDIVSDWASVKFGSDPELFAEQNGRIVGSELVIPKKLTSDMGNAIVRDGVQLELHVHPEFCREFFENNIEDTFEALKRHFEDLNNGTQMNFKAVVRVSRGELNKLSAKSRILGCAPSINIYDENAKLGVNPETYRVRSAGGHIHLGLSSPKLKKEFKRIIRMCDILVGNQCVLIDRDPLQRIRRRVYGRAGECRVQKYGVEYRTLSNFWLRSRPLVSFVLAMARNAVHVIATTDGLVGDDKKWNAEKAIFDYINLKDIIRAINKNDFDLAMKNYEGIEKFLVKHFDANSDGLNRKNVKQFRFFIKMIKEEGIEYWFPKDPSRYWTEGGRRYGWESFLSVVGRRMK